ncbi:MAG: methyl-accepting chemotaxis protein [Mycobacteriales bacterium]
MRDRRKAMGMMQSLGKPVRNASITTKIVAVVLLTCSVFVIASAMALAGISDLTRRNESIADKDVATLAAAARLRTAVSASHDALIYSVLTGEKKWDDVIDSRQRDAETILLELENIDSDTEHKAQIAVFRSHRDAMLVSRNEVRRRIRALDLRRANEILQGTTQGLAETVLLDVERLEAAVIIDVQGEATSARTYGRQARNRVGALLGFGAIFALVGGWVAARLITKPLRRAVDVLTAVAAGDFTQTLEVDSRDEVGRLATALDATIRLLRTTFNTIGGTVVALATASDELARVSATMADSAARTATEADAAAAAASEVSASVESVAAAAEELSMSIREVAAQAANAASVADAGAVRAEAASGTVSELGKASAQIEDVTELITSIAEQTHLLALNATIEAAHAGAVGKGFGVVAQEVKDLARQTTEASGDVRRVVGSIQAGSRNAVEAMADVASVIQEVNENQSTIAAAVEEQNATTRQIGSDAAMAASGSGEIARNIEGVASAARDATAGAAQTEIAANELAEMASGLRTLLAGFRV